MNKVVRDGKVAVLISPNFGAGWSTWNSEYGAATVFCPALVNALLENRRADLESIAEKEFPDAYLGGLCDLEVEWVPQGERFTIDEYDGSESLTILGPDYGYIA